MESPRIEIVVDRPRTRIRRFAPLLIAIAAATGCATSRTSSRVADDPSSVYRLFAGDA
jgi:hypothetical protein